MPGGEGQGCGSLAGESLPCNPNPNQARPAVRLQGAGRGPTAHLRRGAADASLRRLELDRQHGACRQHGARVQRRLQQLHGAGHRGARHVRLPQGAQGLDHSPNSNPNPNPNPNPIPNDEKAREANPERFSGRLKNQALMAALGLPTTGLCGCCCAAPQLKPRLKLSVRRATAQGGAGAAHISAWEEVELPSHLKAIILVNIPSHSAGANPWGSARSAVPQDYADGIIEVVGTVNALHGMAYLSLNKALRLRRGPGCFKRLAQAAEVRLELLEPLHVQVDGEPWLQPAGTFAISCTGKSNVRPLAASVQPALRPDPDPSNPSPDPSPALPTNTLSGVARAHHEGVAPQAYGAAQEVAAAGCARGPCRVRASRGHRKGLGPKVCEQ